ncbi:hypothetical protein BHE90_011382 [Fusarium euwallaceae]|uniref:Uncharacterized protein n=5 Tax=Fusarium solani species complex TaxID=232080 RepID=A0A428QLZ8_9HYPO|nr:hypothetical protein CDV36_011772 [Fusarium kuroshium]RSL66296.1 hypothetical protein CEP54_003854 [Fusarium duplospermum]RSL82485.1 hypothetical protein CEP51_005115 [Fusarium floridanum]RSL97155.1 hypothetical protein CDV31_013177 [Fusarium ambrosium]RTE74184.1 hypothetical protein BHE90_011382 [Fusarium euwallaceae]
MFGSYGSYSSMCASSAPMDITSRSSFTSHDSACAFPSWPRRESLSESDREERPTSYLSDDDLFLPDPFDDDARSVSSAGSSSPGAIASPPNVISDYELLQAERERQAAMQREFIRVVAMEKERRRAAAARKQRRSSSNKKSPKTKLTSIQESAE